MAIEVNRNLKNLIIMQDGINEETERLAGVLKPIVQIESTRVISSQDSTSICTAEVLRHKLGLGYDVDAYPFLCAPNESYATESRMKNIDPLLMENLKKGGEVSSLILVTSKPLADAYVARFLKENWDIPHKGRSIGPGEAYCLDLESNFLSIEP